MKVLQHLLSHLHTTFRPSPFSSFYLCGNRATAKYLNLLNKGKHLIFTYLGKKAEFPYSFAYLKVSFSRSVD